VAVALITTMCFFAYTYYISAWALEVLVSIGENYQLTFTPSLSLKVRPRASFLLTANPAEVSQLSPLALGVDWAYLQVNLTAVNVNGTVFFTGRFEFDTLAERKITIYKEYDPALRTKQVKLTVDAHLALNLTGSAPVDREFHFTWEMTLP